MQNEILINASRGETRVAIIERGTLAELLVERRGEHSMVGSVVKGKVTRVLPGMQASFVDIGLDKAAFLYAGDYFEYASDVDLGDEEGEPRPRARRGRRNGGGRTVPKIDTILSEGQEIMVQVAKEPIGTKGARITSHVAIAGRHLVLTPSGSRVGVSRRIDSDRERRRLREIVERLRPPGLGFIIRTAGEGAREADLEADISYLASVWEAIQLQRDARAPTVLYAEPALPVRMVRDVANPETRRIVVDSQQVYDELVGFVSRFVADPKPRVELYRETLPIFDRYGIEAEIDASLGRKVWLKSGGYLIVDQSEALTAIDVNTGRYVGKRDLEETVLKTNLEAVREVVHQLRFRNIGGLIIVDLIDMESSENREKVYRAFQEALRQDKAKTNILKISELGLVEMTRKRTRENLVQQLCEPCSYCEGRGYVLSRESVAHKVLREIKKDLPRFGGRHVAIAVAPRVAELLLGAEREALAELARELGREIEVRAVPSMHQEQFEVIALDTGPPVPLVLPWLGQTEAEPAPAAESLGASSPLAPAADAEAESAPPAGRPRWSPAAETFSPLDDDEPADAEPPALALQADEPVDAEPEFPILPRPERGEES
jgi:ribonuclease G